MKAKGVFSILLVFSLAFLWGCPNNAQNPSSPQAAPTATFTSVPCANASNTPCTATPTPTSTKTMTPTPTPTCQTIGSVTANIDGADVTGDDTTHSPGINLEGWGPNADIYYFTLGITKTLNFSLCPTLNSNLDKVLIIRQVCWDGTTDLATNDDYCDLLPEINGLTLGPGTYYLIETSFDNTNAGAYTLRIKSGTLGPVCTVTPVATPQPAGEPNDSFVQAIDLGAGVSIGTGQKIATGIVNDSGDTDDYYFFIPLNGGTATAILDCFENGMESADFDLYAYNAGQTVVGSSAATNPVESVSFPITAGQKYYLRANAYFGSGSYRLTVQTP